MPEQSAQQKAHFRLIDLSHEIEANMITYPGLPGPEITEHLTRGDSRGFYEVGTEFAIGRISMVGNTGTYLDSPYHRYDGGVDLAQLPLESLADLPSIILRRAVDAPHAIGPEVFFGIDVAGKAVLVHTGWDRLWRTEAYCSPDHPHLTEATCEWLVAEGVALVGIDSVNIDDTRGGSRPAHSVLLAAGVPVVEHLCGLDQLPDSGFTFTAVPPRVVGFGTFPVRAYARV